MTRSWIELESVVFVIHLFLQTGARCSTRFLLAVFLMLP